MVCALRWPRCSGQVVPCREAAALLRIEQRLQEWQKIQLQASGNAQSNPALVQLGQRIAHLNTAIK